MKQQNIRPASSCSSNGKAITLPESLNHSLFSKQSSLKVYSQRLPSSETDTRPSSKNSTNSSIYYPNENKHYVFHKSEHNSTPSKLVASLDRSFKTRSGPAKLKNKRQLFNACQSARSECHVQFQNFYLRKTTFLQPRDVALTAQVRMVDLASLRRDNLLHQLEELQRKKNNLIVQQNQAEDQEKEEEIDSIQELPKIVLSPNAKIISSSTKFENPHQTINYKNASNFSEKINQLKLLDTYSAQMQDIQHQLHDIEHSSMGLDKERSKDQFCPSMAVSQMDESSMKSPVSCRSKAQSQASFHSPRQQRSPWNESTFHHQTESQCVTKQEQAFGSNEGEVYPQQNNNSNKKALHSLQSVLSPKSSQISPKTPLNKERALKPGIPISGLAVIRFCSSNEILERYSRLAGISTINSSVVNQSSKTNQSTVELASKRTQDQQPLNSKIRIFEEQEEQQQNKDYLADTPSLSPVIAQINKNYMKSTFTIKEDNNQVDQMQLKLPKEQQPPQRIDKTIVDMLLSSCKPKKQVKKPISEAFKRRMFIKSLQPYPKLNREKLPRICLALLKVLRKLHRLKISLAEFKDQHGNIFKHQPLERSGSLLFFKCLKLNSVIAIRSMIQDNRYIVFDFDLKRQTCLHKATMNRQTELLKLFISQGADVEGLDAFGFKPICYALKNKDIVCLNILLKAKANPWSYGSCNFNKFITEYDIHLVNLLKQYRKVNLFTGSSMRDQ